jgi:hypothetical protein
VRAVAWAFAISAALHGAAVAWHFQRTPDDAEQARTLAPPAAPPAAVSPTEPEPMTVLLLSDDTVAMATQTMSRQRHTPPADVSRPAIATRSSMAHDGNATTTTLSPTTPREAAGPQRNPLMTMRGQRPLDTRLPANTPIIGDDAPWGTAVDPNNPKWIANASPAQVYAALAERVARREAENQKLLRPDGNGTSKIERQPFRIKVAADGTVKIRDKANWQQKGLNAEFDVTDAFMREQGMDPYGSEKLKLLDATREERVEIGKRYRTQQLARSAELARNNVLRLWSMTADVRARKQGLFELWDDCAEETTADGSAELAAGGEAARRYVIGFIRSKLPPGSHDAFTPTEIAQLNGARRSRSRFAPY